MTAEQVQLAQKIASSETERDAIAAHLAKLDWHHRVARTSESIATELAILAIYQRPGEAFEEARLKQVQGIKQVEVGHALDS